MNKEINHSLFSLFHHNIYYQHHSFDYDAERLFQVSKKSCTNNIKDIADTIFTIVTEKIAQAKDEEVSFTLTGGMDSRVILACLLKAGIKPNCVTYGNPQAKDIVLASNIARSFSLKFHNACQEKPTAAWYYHWVCETIRRDNGHAHLHRAHRTAAIAEHVEKYHPKILLTGHMGGEGLRGLTYNNYFSSPFFEWVNEERHEPLTAAKIVLNDYFLKNEEINFKQLLTEISSLSWMKHDKHTNKFYFLYDLVGKIHHAQDIRLYRSFIPNVIPVFLEKKYLETIFSSPYNCLSKQNNIMDRLFNPLVYCKMIEHLFPALLDYPLSNGYTPSEYMKGLWYYVPIKLYRDYKKKQLYPATFSYDNWYVDFVKENARNISSDIWNIYDKKRYMQTLEKTQHGTGEGYWHKFSNPIYFDLLEKYRKGIL